MQNERVLFHYNGHGVPKPTPNGEVWVFNKSFTQYIPLSVHDLSLWVGTPAIYVFDCSAAGLVADGFRVAAKHRAQVIFNENCFNPFAPKYHLLLLLWPGP